MGRVRCSHQTKLEGRVRGPLELLPRKTIGKLQKELNYAKQEIETLCALIASLQTHQRIEKIEMKSESAAASNERCTYKIVRHFLK